MLARPNACVLLLFIRRGGWGLEKSIFVYSVFLFVCVLNSVFNYAKVQLDIFKKTQKMCYNWNLQHFLSACRYAFLPNQSSEVTHSKARRGEGVS